MYFSTIKTLGKDKGHTVLAYVKTKSTTQAFISTGGSRLSLCFVASGHKIIINNNELMN